MSGDLEKAKTRLAKGDCTCVLRLGETEYIETQRGVAPLLRHWEQQTDLRGFCAADKVVGKAAAMLYVLLCVREVYAAVLSEAAQKVLQAHGVEVICDTLTPAIRNRTDTGFCPMEQAVWTCDDPKEAPKRIYDAFEQLQKANASKIQ